MKKHLKEYFFITLGVFAMGAGFYYFMVPYNLITGGVGGLSIVIEPYVPFNVVFIVYLLNIGLLILGLVVYGMGFFTKTVYGSIIYPVSISVLLWLDQQLGLLPITDDIMLATVFSAVLMGGGFGLVIRHGGTTGGADIPIKMLYDFAKVPFSVAIYIIDGSIVVIGALVFGLELGMYSVIAVFLIGFISNYVITGGQKMISIQIISDHGAQIKQRIFETTDRGVSLIPIKGGFTGHDKTMVIVVAYRKEYYKIIQAVHEVDKAAFVFVNNSSEVLGEGFEQDLTAP
jgi:uncharacterized membrane-anchored protein YitT (DUF2179 family)